MYLVLKVRLVFKMTLNTHVLKNVTELNVFYDSTKYTKNGITYLIYILPVHVTDVTKNFPRLHSGNF